ncbi:MAG: hypothetical protein AAF999_01610 [Pseudomonadota bacterium]
MHIGLGAFHKAHQAVYTDDALAASGGDWRIIGVSLRSRQPAAELSPQDGRFTLVEQDVPGSKARVIGAIADAICFADAPEKVMDALIARKSRIVRLCCISVRISGGVARPVSSRTSGPPPSRMCQSGLVNRAPMPPVSAAFWQASSRQKS